jgi:hypothetical protein
MHSPAAAAAAAISCQQVHLAALIAYCHPSRFNHQILQACIAADDAESLIFAAGGDSKATRSVLLRPGNADVQPLPEVELLRLLREKGQVMRIF